MLHCGTTCKFNNLFYKNKDTRQSSIRRRYYGIDWNNPKNVYSCTGYTTEQHSYFKPIKIKQAFKYLFLATALSLGFAACQEDPKEDPAVFSISADAQFTNSIATVTVSADKALGSDANVALVLESKSTLPDAALAFNDKAIIKKGAKEASITVTLDDAQLRPGTYEAVFTAKVDGEAVPGEAKVSATVLAPGITISADEALTEGKAKIKVTASMTVVEPIDVALALAATNTVPKDNVTIPEKNHCCCRTD